MRVDRNYIKMIVLAIATVSLYAFASARHEGRKLNGVQVKFAEGDNLFISEKAVNKLLIQNNAGATSIFKEALDLNELETALNSNKMIQNAQVYVSVDGELEVNVKQRTPIARILNGQSYYIDIGGSKMPLSSNYSARVPLVTGKVSNDDIPQLHKLTHTIYTDDFLRKEVVAVHQNKDKDFVLGLRSEDLQVVLGNLDKMELKFKNLKAFYKKAQKDNTLNKYSKVNLQFDNQVVCTKK